MCGNRSYRLNNTPAYMRNKSQNKSFHVYAVKALSSIQSRKFFTAFEHWAKVPLSLFAVQCSDFTCLGMSLSSFSEALSNTKIFDLVRKSYTYTICKSIRWSRLFILFWGKKVHQLFCCKSDFVLSSIIFIYIQKTLKSTNARVKHQRWPESLFSDSDSASVPKFLNPDPGTEIFQIWESDSCSDSGYTINPTEIFACFLLKKWQCRLLLLQKLKSDSGSGSGFSHIFDSGSERKTQNPARVDSGTPDPWPPLPSTHSLYQCRPTTGPRAACGPWPATAFSVARGRIQEKSSNLKCWKAHEVTFVSLNNEYYLFSVPFSFIHLFYDQIRRYSSPLTLRWRTWLYKHCVFFLCPDVPCLEEYIWRNKLRTVVKRNFWLAKFLTCEISDFTPCAHA